MLKLYKSLFAGYLITSMTGAFVMIIAFSVTKQSLFVSVVLALIWIFGCDIYFNMAAVKKYGKKVASLLNNCRIREYIADNEKLLVNCRNKNNRNFLMLNMCAGYFALGNMDVAKQVLFQINPDFGTRSRGIMNSAIYYSDLAALYTAFCDFDRAKQAIASLQSIINNPVLKEAQRVIISRQVEEKNMVLDIKQNNYDGAKKYFQMCLSTETTLLKKVYISFYLANICLHFNETEEAVEHLHFVIENGGDTYYVWKANEMLNQTTENV